MLDKVADDEVDTIIQNCDNQKFKSLSLSILKPLASALLRADGGKCEEAMALASVLVGLISFHLLIPSSPLDPGMKPAAKVIEWNSYLESLNSRLVAIRMESGLSDGNFYPNTHTICTLLEEASHANEKMNKQDKKKVNRPLDIPMFHQLFREIQHFSKTIANVQNVLDLINSFSEENVNSNRFASEMNWQCSASSFFNKIVSRYACYDDVTSPFLAALGIMQNGLRNYACYKLKREELSNFHVLALQDSLLKYPNISHHDSINMKSIGYISAALEVHDLALSEITQLKKIGNRSKFSCLMATLSHLTLMKSANIVKQVDIIKISSWLLGSISRAWDLAGENHGSGNTGSSSQEESEEERNEREFREQFPDHGKDFTKIIEKTEAVAAGEDIEEDDAEIDSGFVVNNVSISDQESNFLAELHYCLYSNIRTTSMDTRRTQAFTMMYMAASHLNHITSRSNASKSERNRFNAHCFALGLNSINQKGRPFLLTTSSDVPDFHRDSNPVEVQKAYRPLKEILHWITQLLRTFPGNAILIGIGQVVEMMLQLDMNKVSVGKMLTGLEVILRKAQDWEQHASHRVALGEKLTQISRLVAHWRKLELQSWSNLLDMRDRNYVVQTRRHWMRLYLLLISDTFTCDGNIYDEEVSVPSWQWKGVSSKVSNLSSTACENINEDIMEILKALDTFILTAGIGHFKERLRLIEAFANQLQNECQYTKDISHKTKATILTSLCEHYSMFIPIIDAEKEKLRKPIETRLKNEVKLAKWDEQSYYSLADSAEKSHRKLMMIVREYDEVLQTSVGKILEDNFLHGIRSNSEVTNAKYAADPVTEIPSNTSMFPDLQGYMEEKKNIISPSIICEKILNLREKNRNWTSVESDSKYLCGIQRYSKKMNRMFSCKGVKYETYASKGYEVANLICATIFERIGSLREKGTKPMKQRALVDLFKYLRKQGYSSMKWSVPKEIREMNCLLQLPSPALKSLSDSCKNALKESEHYFRRSTVELSRLRSEVTMIGSTHMSKREMDLMTGFGDHGLLLLCQQRSVIVKTLSDLKTMSDYIHAFDQISDSLPNEQLRLLESTQNFDYSYASLQEILYQSFLAIKTTALLNKENGETYRNIIGMFEGCCSLVKQSYQPQFNDIFITKDRQEEVARAMEALRKVKNDVISCSTLSRNSLCLPVHFFRSALDQIEICFDSAQSFRCKTSESESENDDMWVKSMNLLLSKLVESSLVAAQNLHKGTFLNNEHKEDDNHGNKEEDDITSIWSSHINILDEWNSIHLNSFNRLLIEVREKLVNKPVQVNTKALDQLSVDICCLVLKVMDKCQRHLSDQILFFRSVSKFEYVKLRLFRVLVAKGFCADDVEEGGDGDGDASNMNFEDDVEGTGMGEGDGKNDVTDEIENEEQLLGLKGDEDQKNTNENNELGEEEAETGMEMENEFDGELFDVPDKKEDDNGQDDDDEEEELDREMGDGDDPNEQVVDEKMWDEDDDDEGEEKQQDEKFEKDSKVSGEALQDELRTKEDDEEEGNGKENSDKPEDAGEQNHDEEAPKDDGDKGANNEEEEMVNDDFEDNYEDQNKGIDVRNEENDEGSDDNGAEDEEEVMDLNDDLQLDDGEDGEDGGGGKNDEDAEDPADIEEGNNSEEEKEDDDNGNGVGETENEDDLDDIDDEMDTDAVQNAHQTLGEDDQMNVDENEDHGDEQEEVEDKTDLNNQEDSNPEAHGVAAKSGADAIKNVKEEDDDDDDGENNDVGGDENEEDDRAGEGDTEESNPGASGQADNNSGDFQSGQEESSESKSSTTTMDVPNPFRDPGDAEKFWHRKLDLITENEKELEQEQEQMKSQEENESSSNDERDPNGTFEFTSENQDNTTQVLGGTTEDEIPQLDQKRKEKETEEDENMNTNETEDQSPQELLEDKASKQEKKNIQNQSKNNEKASQSAKDDKKLDNVDEEGVDQDDINMDTDEVESDKEGDDDNDDEEENKVITDLAQLEVKGDDKSDVNLSNIVEYETQGGISQLEAEEAREKWSKLSAETNSLSRRLCEKLRLVMEPLVASKLRGDYRTGKRINMKRVIGYIASGYRKDKIWLRRTKPGKRDYRVLLAVDNSESMKAGAGDMALTALATLATGMSQLEIGQLGIASFGEEMKLLHPFHAPFTATSGADLVSNFKFDDKRTRTALCVESAISALESQSDSSCSMQLVFMISDGRIERDSRDDLRRLVREMTERSILLVMIIVEGDKNGNMKMKDSIMNMKEVSFKNGKPKVKHFIEDYPFPYYMILQDMNTLPEVLGDALKQWFEMMAQNQS